MKNFKPILGATMLATALSVMPAYAADLGGDCCSDLEERIAELEATTVRKGNRVVSLKLSGHVNQSVLYFDNGAESNIYVGDNGFSSTRFRLTGDAAITSDISAGYNIEFWLFEARSTHVDEGDNSSRRGARGDDGGGGANFTEVTLQNAFMYLESEKLGTISWGKFAALGSDNSDKVSLGGGYSAAVHGDVLAGNSIGIYSAVDTKGLTGYTGLNLGQVAYGHQMNFNGNAIIYDSPTIMGFNVSATWGEDDFWDVSAAYANQFRDFRVAAEVAVAESTDHPGNGGGGVVLPSQNGGALGNRNNQLHDTFFKAVSVSGMHVPTGLFLSAGYSEAEQNWVSAGFRNVDRSEWHVTAGVQHKFLPLGATTAYAEYARFQGYESNQVGATDASNNARYWGLGLVQNVDAAALELYATYRRYEFDLNQTAASGGVNVDPYAYVPPAPAAANVEDITLVMVGGRIKF